MIYYCNFCGIKFARRKTWRISKYCSLNCCQSDTANTHSGILKVVNEIDKIVFEKKFKSREDLKELMELFSTATILLVKFD
jgi:hypothetical protein